MDKRNNEFKELRLKIMNYEGMDSSDSYKVLRELNPDIFIKPEP